MTSLSQPEQLPLHCFIGDHYDLGVFLGKLASDIFRSWIQGTKDWKLMQSLRGKFADLFNSMLTSCHQLYPLYMEEIRGIAMTIEVPFEDIFGWNIRVELFRFLQSQISKEESFADTDLPTGFTESGCSTVLFNLQHSNHEEESEDTDDNVIIVGHNEDGSPELRSHCFMLKYSPSSSSSSNDDVPNNKQPSLGFTTFCYPLMIPGHTFGINECGVIQTINNIRILSDIIPQTPRTFCARQILDCSTAEMAIEILSNNNKKGHNDISNMFSAFHHTIAQGSKLYSVEAALDKVSVMSIQPTTRTSSSANSASFEFSSLCSPAPSSLYAHANHLIHSQLSSVPQYITDSSQARQHRMDDLIQNYQLTASPTSSSVSVLHILVRTILQDCEDSALPIFRADQNDPDGENTIATVIYVVSKKNGVSCSVYTGVPSKLCHEVHC